MKKPAKRKSAIKIQSKPQPFVYMNDIAVNTRKLTDEQYGNALRYGITVLIATGVVKLSDLV